MSPNQSTILLQLNGISIHVKIISPLSRKTRRAALLCLFRSSKEQIRHLHLNRIYHSDEPWQTTVSTMIRGTVAADAQTLSTLEQKLGYFIRIVRTKTNQTQKEFARHLGISQAQLSRLEHGQRNLGYETRQHLDRYMKQELERTPAGEDDSFSI